MAGKSQSARPSCTQIIDAPVLRKYRFAAACFPSNLSEEDAYFLNASLCAYQIQIYA